MLKKKQFIWSQMVHWSRPVVLNLFWPMNHLLKKEL